VDARGPQAYDETMFNAKTVRRVLFGFAALTVAGFAETVFREAGVSVQFAFPAGLSACLAWMAITGSGCG